MNALVGRSVQLAESSALADRGALARAPSGTHVAGESSALGFTSRVRVSVRPVAVPSAPKSASQAYRQSLLTEQVGAVFFSYQA